jgi:hypothetical protein
LTKCMTARMVGGPPTILVRRASLTPADPFDVVVVLLHNEQIRQQHTSARDKRKPLTHHLSMQLSRIGTRTAYVEGTMKPAAQWAREDGLYVADNEYFRKCIQGKLNTEGTAESPLRPTHQRSQKGGRVRVRGHDVHEAGT